MFAVPDGDSEGEVSVDPEHSPLRIVTLSTTNFRPTAERLLYSLARIHPEADIDVYVDDHRAFEGLSHPRAQVIEFDAVRSLGVKRARFPIYCDAMSRGPFVYLDADIVVLDRLDGLVHGSGITACDDDLSGCPFIADRSHPWPRDVLLPRDVYVNAGVMGFAEDIAPFLERCRQQAAEDTFWNAHIHPDGLFDNHVLCALLNIERPKLNYVSEFSYNWQGLCNPDGSLAAEIRDGRLVHAASGETLRLAHFAGVRDVDRYLLTMPFDVAHILNRASIAPMEAARAASAVSAGASDRIRSSPDAHVRTTVDVTARAFVDSWTSPDEPVGPFETYVSLPDEMISIALAIPPTPTRWNGLQCGGAYLEPIEYAFLRDLVEQVPSAVVVETGAGETSRLFAHRSSRVISIEPHSGPWFERAQEVGVEAHLIPFNASKGFDADRLTSVLERVGKVDLLFLDSPTGTNSRAVALAQLLGRVRPDHVVVHDARRDLAALLPVIAPHDYVVAASLNSFRGLSSFSLRTAAPLVPAGVPMQRLSRPRAAISTDATVRIEMGADTQIAVRVRNTSQEHWSTVGDTPVVVSYHIEATDVFDGHRTALPCNMAPGDEVELLVLVSSHHLAPGNFDLTLTLVQEGMVWFDQISPESAITIPLTITRPR